VNILEQLGSFFQSSARVSEEYIAAASEIETALAANYMLSQI
jgi:hypothetical protein